ncbi:MAG: terpene cyclase/mutase family protein [Planctomycetes bacterium]|nr:terpene cyclase/mutase family protein [Planctomycetota bacterium]
MIRTCMMVGVLALASTTAVAAGEAQLATHNAAVDWLLQAQHKNGGFGQIPGEEEGELGITALVLRGLAGLPDTVVEIDPDAEATPEHKRALARVGKVSVAVTKAVEFLLKHQQPDGSFSKGKSGLGTYRTAIAVSALVAVDREKYADAIQKATTWLKADQFDEGEGVKDDNPHYGGYGYDHEGTKPDADLSNTQIALTALKDAGISPDDPVFKRAMTFLERCQNSSETNPGIAKLKPKDDGGFIYDPGLSDNKSAATQNDDGTTSYESYASMTYSGLMSLLYAGLDESDARVQAAQRWIAANYTLEENRGLGVRAKEPDAAQQGLYYYYHSFAKCLSALGKKMVKTEAGDRAWAVDLFEALGARQNDDGSFKNANSRWWEQDPVLCTAYALNAMNFAAPFLAE